MNDAKHSNAQSILLVDPQEQSSNNTAFLLQLAGCAITTRRELDEAINYVMIFYPEGDGPNVILIDNLEVTPELPGLIDLLGNHSPGSKILLIDRSKRPKSPTQQKYQVISSRHVLGEIRACLEQQICAAEANSKSASFPLCGWTF